MSSFSRPLIIVSRKSPLALWQAEFVKAQLKYHHPDLDIQILGVTTEGDTIQDIALAKIGGKGLFVKALEEQLLANTADIAVHSMKDVPAELPEGLEISVILKRGNPRDALVAKEKTSMNDLPNAARIGTSSLRRQAQLLGLRPDLQMITLRGNVDSRIVKLENQVFDAMILAVAGLERLNLEVYIQEFLDPKTQMLPAVGQGALGIQCRVEDEEIKALIAPLHDLNTGLCVTAERSMNALLGGSCQLPVAGLAAIDSLGHLQLQGMVADPSGQNILKTTASGKKINAVEIGRAVAEQLLALGAQKIIDSC